MQVFRLKAYEHEVYLFQKLLATFTFLLPMRSSPSLSEKCSLYLSCEDLSRMVSLAVPRWKRVT